jgi:hypothetical protein
MIEKRKALTCRPRTTQNKKQIYQKIFQTYPNSQNHYPAQNYLTSPAYINGVAAMATLCRSASTC